MRTLPRSGSPGNRPVPVGNRRSPTSPETSRPTAEDGSWLAQQAEQHARPAEPTALTNGQPLTLVEAVENEARGYRAWRTPEGDFLARQLERLAQLGRFTGASSPEEFDERLQVLEADVREHRYQIGYGDGSEDGRQEFGRCWVE
jgi:hypothetical protein